MSSDAPFIITPFSSPLLNDQTKEGIHVTVLKPESYDNWRSNTKKSPKANRSSQKLKVSSIPKKTSEKLSFTFKLTHHSSEYQDNYLKGRQPKKIPEKAASQQRLTSPLTETNGGNISEYESKHFIEKIQNKAEKFNPKLNLFNIMKIVTRELDNDPETKVIREKIRPASKLEMLERIKTQSLHTIRESIKQTELEKVKAETKCEITRVSNQMNDLLDKTLRENQNLKDSLDIVRNETDELKMENEKLIRRNQILTQNLKELSLQNEKLLQEIQKLETFKYSYKFFTDKFPNLSIEKFIDKFLYLENTCCSLTKRVNVLEDDNRIIDQEKNTIEKKIEEANYKMDLKNLENEKMILKYQAESQNTESLVREYEKYKDSYLQLFRKIMNVFSKWSEKIKIYYDHRNPVPPQASLDDPIEILDIMDRMVQISTPEKLQAYLRKIIVIANVLQRKYFQDNVNEKFDPDKIYNRIIGKFDKMEEEQKNLISELTYYRKHCESPTIKRRASSAMLSNRLKHLIKSESNKNK